MERRTSRSLACAWLIWLVAVGLVAAQEVAPPSASRAPVLDLTAVSDDYAVAVDPTEGSTVIGGRETDRVASCGPISRAYVARYGGDGEELWRRNAGELFAAANGFAPRHVLASVVRAIAVEPATGRIFVLGEAHLGWQGGDCSGGIATARATFVVALAPDGTAIAGTILGDDPAGPPPHELACDALCPTSTSSRLAGLGIALDTNGDVLVISRQSDDHQNAMLEEAFVTQRLDRDLRPVVVPVTVPLKVVPCQAPTSNLIRVDPLYGTEQFGSDAKMGAYGDGCSISWMTMNPFPSGGTYGFEAEYQIQIPPNLTELVFDLSLDYQGGMARFDFYLMRVNGGRDLIESRSSGMDGRIDTSISGEITTDRPWDYLDPLTGRVVSQVEIRGIVEHTVPGGNCEDTHGDYGGGNGR